MWTVPALVFLAIGVAETPQMIENARAYEEQTPVIEVQELQAGNSSLEADFPTLGWND
jgi:hypothetical protein